MYAIRALAGLLMATWLVAAALAAEPSRTDPAALAATRDEAMAYSIGLQAYFYGYPAVDYERVMGEQTTPGSPRAIAPANQFFMQTQLMEPGSKIGGRAPNTDTLYFRAWLDLRDGPVTVEAPDTDGRYYSLTYADFYSEVQHTGRRTTGTQAQRIWVTGPGWQGDVPADVQLIRLRTHRGYLFGRVLVNGPQDLAAANAVMAKFRIHGSAVTAAPQRDLADAAALTSLAYFRCLNRFLKTNPRLPGEEALMAAFDAIGIGPAATFDAQRLSEGTRRGLERAVSDGHAILAAAPGARPANIGWGPMGVSLGKFGFDYLARAINVYHGFVGNLAEESIYPSALTDSQGGRLDGKRKYRVVFAPGHAPPTDAFWAMNVYDIRTAALIPNPEHRYSVGDNRGLVMRKDGAIEVRLQSTRPAESDVNWLPTGEGLFFLTLRMYQPRPQALNGAYRLPPIEVVE